ncbi:MAG: polysaccharide biosynthesis protein [Oscillospiraceae bacterium]|nr:polysaccharide biosynthesis protein [Oscillospiraceae bacterium]
MRGRHETVRGKHEAPSSSASRNSTAPSVKETSEQTRETTNTLCEASSGKKQNFMHGAAILTVGVVIMKLLGAIYKVPLGNILGDYGYGIFLATYNVYNIFFTLSTAGLPVALSRLIAEADARGQESLKEKTFRAAIVTFAAIGMVFSLIMFFGNQWLATAYLVKPDAALSVRAMAPAILLVCLVSAYRGYCQGNGNMIPTTVDEVLEVLFKVISGLAISALLVHAGRGLPEASAGAILGVSIGSVISLGYMIVYKHRNYRRMSVGEEVKDSGLKIAGTILKIGIPISLGASIMAILSSLDPGICHSRLAAAGFSEHEAGVLFGVYGKVQTLFNLPAAFMTPLTIAIVPAVAGAIAKGNRREAEKTSEDAMRMASVISMPMGVGLAVLAFPIVNVLYPNSHSAGPGLLRIMGLASFFVCIVLMENAILQASGRERLPMIALITGSLVKIAVNWVIIVNPSINIYGAPVGTLIGYFCMAALDYIFIRRALNQNPNLLKAFGKPFFCSLAMGGSAFLIYRLADLVLHGAGKIGLALGMMLSIAVAVAVYMLAVIRTRCITGEDLQMIPGGAKVGRILHIQ